MKKTEGKVRVGLQLVWGESDGQAAFWNGISLGVEVRVMGLGEGAGQAWGWMEMMVTKWLGMGCNGG